MISVSRNQLLIILLIIFSSYGYAQEETEQKTNEALYKKLQFFNLRSVNAVDFAIGTSLLNGDYPNPEFEVYMRIGYRHFITEHINVNFSYNKYNIAFDDTFNEGYMSFDINFEYLFSPYNEFSPFAYAGFGYNAANYFETSQTKAQVALGLEYIILEGVGVKLFGEFNQVFSDELEGLIMPGKDDSLFRLGLGVNIYFGGNKRKERLLNSVETIINSNLIN